MLTLLLACTGPNDAPADVDKGDDTAPPEIVDNTLTVDGVHLELAAIETVVNVRWTTAAPSRARVTASFTDGTVVVEESAADTAHAVLLVGLPPLTTVTVHVEALDGGGVDEATTTTGASPSWMPDLLWTADAPDAAEPGFTVVPIFLSSASGVAVLDRRGRAVWTWPTTEAELVPLLTRARLSLDGEAILFNNAASGVGSPGDITRVSLDGSTVETVGITEGHIDFVEYTPGGYASLGWDLRVIDERKLVGDRLVERAPDGTEREVWNVWDHFAPDLSRTYDHYYAADPDVEDWTHINGVTYDPTEDVYYLTMSYQSTVLKIDRQTGEQLWALTDTGVGDFANPGEDEFLELPHSVQPIDGGVLVFNRSNFRQGTGCASADEIALDEALGEASLQWHYASETCLLIPYLGSAQRLPAGNTLVSWTNAGQLDEVTPDGVLTWRVNTALGAGVGFVTRVPTLTPPSGTR
ncbi:MAG: aryl-sulfate sulfotransferase [Myxococcota bacterium]